MKNTIYAFNYCPCIHESAWATISLHYSEEGAIKAMNEHKEEKREEFDDMYKEEEELSFEFGTFEDWYVGPVPILP